MPGALRAIAAGADMRRAAAPLAMCIFLGACFTGDAPVSDESIALKQKPTNITAQPRPQAADAKTHLIQPGDTLHAIAWRYAIYFRELAEWNNLQHPYTIYVGKRLRLTPPQAQAIATSNRPAKGIGNTKTKASLSSGSIKWSWPVRNIGKVKNSKSGKLLLPVPHGQVVHAAAAGQVVYSGAGVRGYGKLLIIKHNDEFLSAYGNNSELLVNEGDAVKSGQQIAKSGSIPGETPALYFEIRRYGKAANTISYLP